MLYTALLCSDSMFNMLKRVTDSSFLFLCKTLVFLFLPFLNLGAQIGSTDLESALDQHLLGLLPLQSGTRCDVLRDLVLSAQFKKREKHRWRSVTFSKVAGFYASDIV